MSNQIILIINLAPLPVNFLGEAGGGKSANINSMFWCCNQFEINMFISLQPPNPDPNQAQVPKEVERTSINISKPSSSFTFNPGLNDAAPVWEAPHQPSLLCIMQARGAFFPDCGGMQV